DVVVGNKRVRKRELVRKIAVQVGGDIAAVLPRLPDRVIDEQVHGLARPPTRTGQRHRRTGRVVGLITRHRRREGGRARSRGRGRSVGRGRPGRGRTCGVGRGRNGGVGRRREGGRTHE